MSDIQNKLGQCIICGERIFDNDSYITSTEGYCHNSCIVETSLTA